MAWVSDYIPYNIIDVITYPYPNLHQSKYLSVNAWNNHSVSLPYSLDVVLIISK